MNKAFARNKNNTAVLFLVFNRPDTTAQVFEAIRKARPPRLYVAADGPRTTRKGEAERVEEVRKIATAVDWPCEVKTLFRLRNLGCKQAVGEAISWFFEHEKQGIILEDDVLPSTVFFEFCQQGLKRYVDCKSIGGLGGFVPYKNSAPFLSMHGSVWGWATWRDRWEKAYISDLEFTCDDVSNLAKSMSIFSVAEKSRIARVLKKQEIDTWDYYWMFSRAMQNLFMILPGLPLTENIGFCSPDASHTHGPRPAIFKRLSGELASENDVNFEKIVVNMRDVILIDYKRFIKRNGPLSFYYLLREAMISPMIMIKASKIQFSSILFNK